jgi:hypothetical protein
MIEIPDCENLYAVEGYLLANCRHSDNTNYIAEMVERNSIWEITKLDTGIKSVDYLYADDKFVVAAGSRNSYFFRSDLGFNYPERARTLGHHHIYRLQKILKYENKYIFSQPEYSMIAYISHSNLGMVCDLSSQSGTVLLTLVYRYRCDAGACQS